MGFMTKNSYIKVIACKILAAAFISVAFPQNNIIASLEGENITYTDLEEELKKKSSSQNATSPNGPNEEIKNIIDVLGSLQLRAETKVHAEKYDSTPKGSKLHEAILSFLKNAKNNTNIKDRIEAVGFGNLLEVDNKSIKTFIEKLSNYQQKLIYTTLRSATDITEGQIANYNSTYLISSIIIKAKPLIKKSNTVSPEERKKLAQKALQMAKDGKNFDDIISEIKFS